MSNEHQDRKVLTWVQVLEKHKLSHHIHDRNEAIKFAGMMREYAAQFQPEWKDAEQEDLAQEISDMAKGCLNGESFFANDFQQELLADYIIIKKQKS